MNTTRLILVTGDITREITAAIVNAANNSLLGGGGVDGAIHRAAGPRLLDECSRLGGCPTGDARITHGYNLRASWVIHTVGPVWRGGNHGEDALLANCYRRCLEIARDRNLESIAFPSISTGAYGFPVERASAIAVREIHSFLATNRLPKQVRIVCFDQTTYQAYQLAVGSEQ